MTEVCNMYMNTTTETAAAGEVGKYYSVWYISRCHL